jgi:hypothetical protein
MFAMELEDVRAYARHATTLMLDEAIRHEKYVDNVVTGMSKGEADAYFENNYDTYELLVRRFPNQQQQSLIVLTYAVIESRLVAIARTLLKDEQPGLVLKDLAGDSPFQKARKVITRIAGLDVPQKLWERVEPFRLIRNAIVHNAGEIPEPTPPVEALLKQHAALIKNSTTSGLTVEPGFVVAFTDVCAELLEEVFTQWATRDEKRAADGAAVSKTSAP